jgi:MraZ protein
LDAKGRVSVPTRFREILAAQGTKGLWVRKHRRQDYLECGAESWLADMNGLEDGLDPDSDEYEDLQILYFGDAEFVPFDQEGRAIVPKRYLEIAGIKDRAVFLGKRACFAVMSPATHAARLAKAREGALSVMARRRALREDA